MNKQVPHSVDAEQKILGTILHNPEIIHSIIDRVTVEDFYIIKHQYILRSLLALKGKNKPFSEEQILAELNLSAFNPVNEIDLISIQENFTDSDSLEPYIALVKSCTHKRTLINHATELLKSLYDEQDHEKMIESTQKTIYAMTATNKSTSVTIKQGMSEAFQYLSDFLKKGQLIKSQITELDGIIRGFEPGQFVVLAARPSMGKTALGLSIAANIIKMGSPVGFFSIEMTNQQMALRLLSIESGLGMSELYNGSCFTNSEKFTELAEVAGTISRYPFWLDDASKTMAEIRTQARKWVVENGIRFIVIDYLGLIRPTRYRESRNLEVAEISEGLKSLAKELRIPIMALSQLSRGVEGRADTRPKLSDLRDSGAIEQDADIVMFLYRESYYNPEADLNAAELIVAKNRNGKTGMAPLHFTPTTMRFE